MAIVPGLILGYGLDEPYATALEYNNQYPHRLHTPRGGFQYDSTEPGTNRLIFNQGVNQEVAPSGDINQSFSVNNSGNYATQYVTPTLNANTGSGLDATNIGGVLQYSE